MADPVAYLVEGFDGGGKLYAKIVHFTVDEARDSAAKFARHYATVTTTPLVRATYGCVLASEPTDYPECSGDPASCPENEGHGCCGGRAIGVPGSERMTKTEGMTLVVSQAAERPSVSPEVLSAALGVALPRGGQPE